MKSIVLSFILLLASQLYAQEHQCAKAKQQSMATIIQSQNKSSAIASAQISHEINYDVKFVHLNLNLERTNKNISGGVRTIARVSAASMDTFMTLLHLNHTIDSMRFNGNLVTPLRQDSMVKVGLTSPLSNGTSFTVDVYYHGTAPTGGSAIGSGFSNGTSGAWGNQVTWSLSESFLA